MIGPKVTGLLIEIYKSIVGILRQIKYSKGFDLYISKDGIHFESIFRNGLDNPNNYGGRILYVDDHKNLYIGTANPFQGCEVWKASDIDGFDTKPCGDDYYKNLWEIRKIVSDNYDILSQCMPEVLKFIPKEKLL